MNETPLHEPLIAEEGKEKERVFTGTPERIVNICLASISALIIYWTVYVSADVMWKHGLYIMTVFCMTLVIYPFEKKPKVNHVSLVDWLLIIGSIAGSAYAIWEYLDRFMRLGMLTEMDIFFGCLMLFLGLEVGRRVIGWSLTLVSIVLILYSLYGFVIPGHFGHGGFDLEAVVTQVYAGMEGYYGLSAKMMIQYVAPFILMGAFLEKSGAGDFFIRLAFALTRNTVGGPAKAAVIGSALLGSISGSVMATFLYVACSEWWLRGLDSGSFLGIQSDLFRNGFRMVVFSVVIMIVVLFFRRGIMGDREITDLLKKRPRKAAKEAAK